MRATTLATGTSPEGEGFRDFRAGGCSTWALPPDKTCPGVARSIVRRTLTELGLPDGFVADIALGVSELSTNAIVHAAGDHLSSQTLPAGPDVPPELWLYRRGHDRNPQFVVAIYDALRGWRDRDPGRPDELFAEDGRGLGIVESLADGHNGLHLTRSRLGPWHMPGKACWFALPIPASCPQAYPPRLMLTEAQAVSALESMLAERGIDHLIRRDAHRQSVLSVRCGLTVWCRSGAFWWTNDGAPVRRPISDVTEVAERLVQSHEELTAAEAGGAPSLSAGSLEAPFDEGSEERNRAADQQAI
ncbi:MAG TPA: ATP-binding protein [Streptosporangiaceae bacterium]